MNKTLMQELEVQMNLFLEYSDGQRDPLCYETLAQDMAKAAALVYVSCMKGQAYAEAEAVGRKT